MRWSPLPYPGAKTHAVRHLAPLVPTDVKRVISPFCGGCSFEIALAMAGILVLAFDNLRKLINFWTVLRESPDILAERVQLVYREFGEDCFRRLLAVSGGFTKYNRAASYYAIKRAQFNRAESGNYVPGHPRFTESSIRLLRKFEWPQLLSVAWQDFRDTLRQFILDFLYLDPPYYLLSNLYGYSGIDWCHEELATQLRQHRGRFLLCYNDDPHIRALYSDYLILEASHLWKYGANKSKAASEIFILNYELDEEQLIKGGFDPWVERKPSDAVSWDRQRKIYAFPERRIIVRDESDAIILRGDSKETLKAVRSESVNLIVTSPPYNLGKKYGARREPRRSLGEYLDEIFPILEELYRILGPRGNLAWQVGAANHPEKTVHPCQFPVELIQETGSSFDTGK